MQSLRFAFRALRRNSSLSIVAVITLALGIGANTAIFSVVNAVLLRPFDFQEPERIVVIWENFQRRNIPYMFVSPPTYADFGAQNRVFEEVAAFDPISVFLRRETETERLFASRVTASFWPLLGAKPILGRGFSPDEEGAGRGRVAVLSYNLWRDRYGADPGIIGQSIILNEEGHRVVGVMPAEFTFPPAMDLEGGKLERQSDVWVPYTIDMRAGQRGGHFLRALGRLKRGVTLKQAADDVHAIASRLARENPKTNEGWDALVVPLTQQVLGDIRPALIALLGAVGFVLLIACVNVANLLLARGALRRKEFSIRTALGAGRGQLVRLMLAESMILSSAGTALGLLLASWGIRILVNMAPQNVPRLHETSIDATVLGFAVCLALATGLVFGLISSLQAFRADVNEAMKDGGRSGTTGRANSRLRSALIVSEVALSLVLLVGAGLLLQSFVRMRAVDAGFNPENVLTMKLTVPQTQAANPGQRVAIYRDLEHRLNGLAGVSAAGFVLEIPLTADRQGTEVGRDAQAAQRREELQTNFTFATPGYFAAMGMTLLRGRNFNDQDAQDKANVVIINGALARRMFPDEDPIGKQIHVGFNFEVAREVVGVIGDERHNTLRDAPVPNVYTPYYQVPWSNSMSLAIRTSARTGDAVAAIRGQVNAAMPNVPIYDVKSMHEVVDEALVGPLFSGTLTGIFSGLALIMAAVGISGFVSFMVAQRSREIGIRMALGAQSNDVLRMILSQGLRLTLTGIVIGAAASLALGRLLSSLLYDVAPGDAGTIAALSLLLAAVVMFACYLPARRALRVDPVLALRTD